jgi:hypothetical protein
MRRVTYFTDRLTYTNVVATLALVLAMTGGAMAADKYLITSIKQIKPSVRRSLRGERGKVGMQGPMGPAGAQGPEGKPGAPGPAGPEGKPSLEVAPYYSRFDGDPTHALSSTTTTIVGAISLPAGSWALLGVVPLRAVASGSQEIGCGVVEGTAKIADAGYAQIGTVAGATEYDTLTFTALVEEGGYVDVGCNVIAGSGSTEMDTSATTLPTITAELVSDHTQIYPPPP